MHVFVWILQIVLAALFTNAGIQHFTLPPNLPAMNAWMYDMSPGLHAFAGTLELLGAAGLILPGLTKIQTRLTPLAAAGLALTMLGAAIYHIPRGEYPNIVGNLVFMALCAFVAYMRWKKIPLQDRA